MQEIYKNVARRLAEKIESIFTSEETLELEFKRNYESLPFSRTDHWGGILFNLFRESWLECGPEVKAEPTAYDKIQVLRIICACYMLDFNLLSQILLNMQEYTGMAYQAGDAEKEINRLKELWGKEQTKLDPFAPKARMVKIADVVTEEDKKYNDTLSSLKALRIISKFTPNISFRVSAKGQTPAFADSMNLSMLGQGGDKYLKTLPDLGAFYLTWESAPHLAKYIPTNPPDERGMKFEVEGVPYPFFSKSGGDILQDVIFARKLIYCLFSSIDITQETLITIPRMNSILVVCDKYGSSLKKTVDKLKEIYPMLGLVEGGRV